MPCKGRSLIFKSCSLFNEAMFVTVIYSPGTIVQYEQRCYIMGVGTGGAQGARAPPIILPSEIFLTQYALLSRKLAHIMFIFNKIFRLASLANQDTSTFVTKKSTNSNVQIISPHLSKKFLCSVSSKQFRRYATNYSTSNPLH